MHAPGSTIAGLSSSGDASSAAGDGAHSLRQAVFHLMSATKQMAMAGTDAQRQRTTELLDATRKKIYAMLASDDV